MIVRVFRMRVKPGLNDAYEQFIQTEVLPRMLAAPGLVSVQVGRPLDDPPVEFLIVSVWDSLASLRAFAGHRWRDPIVFPGEAELVFESLVDHYELMEVPAGRPSEPETPPV